jgi:hypothetical protein
MFRIRQPVFDALTAALRDEFARRVERHLAEHHPEAVAGLSEAERLERIHAAIRRAAGYGLRSEPVVAWFVVLDFVVSPGFDRHPTVHRLLTHPGIAEETKPAAVLAEMTEADWAEAGRVR